MEDLYFHLMAVENGNCMKPFSPLVREINDLWLPEARSPVKNVNGKNKANRQVNTNETRSFPNG